MEKKLIREARDPSRRRSANVCDLKLRTGPFIADCRTFPQTLNPKPRCQACMELLIALAAAKTLMEAVRRDNSAC